MRRIARVDGNQKDIVAALRKIGAAVQPLSSVGDGCPDLLVGHQGKNVLMEVKDPSKPTRDQRLTDAQVKWHGAWVGQVAIVRSAEEAMEVLNDA